MTRVAEVAALYPAPNPGRDGGAYSYTAERCWCSWNSFYGGALFGALIATMEDVAAQPLLSASAQFLGMVAESDRLEVAARRVAGGKSVTQARAVATMGGAEVISANGVLGRFATESLPVPAFPAVPPPGACPLRTSLNPVRGGLNDTLEARIAGVESPSVRFWVRCPAASGEPLAAPMLAALADYPPPAVTLLLGGGAYGISLDATLRVAAPLDREDAGGWFLLDVRFDALLPPFAIATVRVWSEARVLIGIGTQSMSVRQATPPARKP